MFTRHEVNIYAVLYRDLCKSTSHKRDESLWSYLDLKATYARAHEYGLMI